MPLLGTKHRLVGHDLDRFGEQAGNTPSSTRHLPDCGCRVGTSHDKTYGPLLVDRLNDEVVEFPNMPGNSTIQAFLCGQRRGRIVISGRQLDVHAAGHACLE